MQLDCKEEQLTAAYAQRDEITSKYNFVSQRVFICLFFSHDCWSRIISLLKTVMLCFVLLRLLF